LNQCTPYRGNLTNTHPTLNPRMVPDHTYLMRSTHITFRIVVNRVEQVHCSQEKRALDPIHSMTVDRSVGPYPVSLPRQPLKQWGKSQPSVDGRLLDFLGPYLWHAIGTFNTCSQGLTHQSLTNTGGGYNLGHNDFPHHTARPSQPMVLRFPPKGPTRSQVIQSQHKLK
jgi:hypothetical protein